LKTCPLFATGTDGEASGEILVACGSRCLRFNRFFFQRSKLQQRGFFVGFDVLVTHFFVDFLGFRLGTDRSGEELIRTRALLGIVG
jgi:hypothetical protein